MASLNVTTLSIRRVAVYRPKGKTMIFKQQSKAFGRRLVGCMLATIAFLGAFAQQPAAHYQPTLESLNQHSLPQWYADAKLGIFIHWGLYSVPGWAPLVHPTHDFTSLDYIRNNPYAEWYLNTMRLEGSPTQAYHRAHYGVCKQYV